MLTPLDTGRTVHDQPALHWFLSGSTPHLVEWTLVDDRTVMPLVEARLPDPKRPGVQRIRLGDWGVRLASGVAYSWYVSIVPDPEHRSKDIVAWGRIERVEPPEGLAARLRQAGPESGPSIYAEAGLWYDALDSLWTLIDKSADPAPHRLQWASLLEQVGLPEIAMYDAQQP